MIELSFHKELYDGFAIDEAARAFERFAAFERVEQPHRWLLRVSANDAAREGRLARELENFALGLTIERAAAAPPAEAPAPPGAEP